MSFFAIQNFRFGLDSRRDQLTTQPGALLVAENCHVNEGGEVEKRKAFTRGLGLTGTYGMVAGATQLYVFGSTAVPGGLPATLLGATLTYVRCQHPDLATAMSNIVSGTLYAGLPFVIARFADGNQYPYYNGTVVSDYIAGLILASQNTNTKIGTAFAGLITNRTNGLYTATDHVNGTVDIFNLPGSQYTATFVKTTAAGTVTAVEQAANVPSVQQGAAVGHFAVLSGTANPGTNKISSVKVNGVEILNVAVNWVTDNAHTAVAVALQINTYASSPEYIASANGNTVNIFTTLAASAAVNGFVVSATGAGNVCLGDCIVSFTLNAAAPTQIVTSLTIGGTDVCAGGVNWTTDIATSVAAIVTAINAQTGTHGYLAYSTGSVLRVAKAVTTSADVPIGVTIIPGPGIGIAVGSSATLSAIVKPDIAAGVLNTFVSQAFVAGKPTPNVTCLVSGGVPFVGPGGTLSYSYLWTLQSLSPPTVNTFSPSQSANAPTQPVTYFTSPLTTTPVPNAGDWVCTVTDAEGNIAVSNVLRVIFS